MDLNEDNEESVAIYLVVEEIIQSYLRKISIIVQLILSIDSRKRKRSDGSKTYSMINRIPSQVRHLNRIIGITDVDCIANLQMDRNTFGRLCLLLKQLGGLEDGIYVSAEEQVATFLGILAHHKKNRIIGFDYWRSGQTVLCYLHKVLKSVLKLHGILLLKPEPVAENCTDPRWRWFKGCLGALDGTYINVKVCSSDKPRYRSRKGDISTNTLAVCDRKLRFVYVLPGWEGSAADSRILRNAINRTYGLKVPHGNYYLCDNGYANSEGFLTPYRSMRYHLKEWGHGNSTPQNAQELFNMRHSKASNVIECAFGIMKMRWEILRSASYYPIKVQIRMITTCFLLHNFIRSVVEVDPIEVMMEDEVDAVHDEDEAQDVSFVDGVQSTLIWNQKRNSIAFNMWEVGQQ